MIVGVAIRFRGDIYALPKPKRHYHVLWEIAEKLKLDCVDALGDDQGFIDSAGRYLTRKEALVVARECGQLIRQERSSSATRLGELYSEDLW